jgi:tetratricopeptide (TPR) repeat protein
VNLFDPSFAPGLRLSNLTAELIGQGRKAEAISTAIGAVTLEPTRLEPYANLAGAYEQVKGCESWQIAACKAGLNIPRNPNDDPREDLIRADLFHNMALAQNRLYQWQAALESANAAHRLNPGNPWTLGLAAMMIDELGDPATAIKFLQGGIKLIQDPECPYNDGTPAARRFHREAELACAIGYLMLGDLEKYFQFFERRLQLGAGRPEIDLYQKGELWRPSQPVGERVLVILEQGIGDQIQFARLIPTFREHNPQIKELGILCHPALARLFTGFDLGIDFVVAGGEGPAVAAEGRTYIASFDLIRWLYENGSADFFGSWPGPYIRAHGKANIPREAAPDGGQKTIIGFCWQGSKEHLYDWARSFPLETFLKWADTRKDRCTFVSLQHGENGKLPNWIIDGDRGPFHELAEVVNACDVIVGPDTSLLHLAGAMGKPAVMLHTFHWEWRWRRPERFYAKTFRHLRQAEPGNWDELLSRLGPELDKLLGAVEQAELLTAMAR